MNLPESIEGQAVLSALSACVRGGMTGPEIDMAGALAMARAEGVPASVAASLISAAFAGVRAGVASKREADGQ